MPTPETVAAAPMAAYGQSKYCAERYCGWYERLYGLATVTLRYGNVYGPRQDPNGEAGVIAIFAGRAARRRTADDLRRRPADARLHLRRRHRRREPRRRRASRGPRRLQRRHRRRVLGARRRRRRCATRPARSDERLRAGVRAGAAAASSSAARWTSAARATSSAAAQCGRAIDAGVDAAASAARPVRCAGILLRSGTRLPGPAAERARPARAASRPSARRPRRRRSAPPSRAGSRAFSTLGQRRTTSTSKVGRCSSANASGSRPHASQMTRAISATVISSPAETLKSSFSPAGEAIAVTMPSAMSSTCVSVRVCVPSPKIGSGALVGQRQALLDDVGDHVRDAGLVLGHLARAVGVERAADRVGQAVLVVRGAHVDLAGELARSRRPSAASGTPRRAPRSSGTASRARRPSTRRRRRSARRRWSSAARDDAVVERVVDLGQRVAAACGSWRSRRRSPRGG